MWRSHVPTAAEAPAAPNLPAAEGLRVILIWGEPVDLDLYLTDPSAETVYFGNNPSRSGARLERDLRCEETHAVAPFVELAHMPRPLPGQYRVGVDFSDACSTNRKQEVPFRVIAEMSGARREATGVAQFERFEPTVLEFTLDPDGPK